MKRILSAILKTTAAAVLTIAAAGSVWATPIPEQGYGTTVTDNVLEIKKHIKVRYELAEGSAAPYVTPAITYTYAVTPADPPAGAIMTSGGKSADVHRGPVGGVTVQNTGGQVSFTHQPITKKDDEYIEGILKLDINLENFTEPGIYRYLIEDTTNIADLFDAGIVRTSNGSNVTDDSSNKLYVKDRYLDILITEDGGVKKVGAYILMKENPLTNDGTSIKKSVGFTVDDSSGYDSYRNYYSSLTKKVTGGLGDKSHRFPFTVVVNNDGAPFYWSLNDSANLKYTGTENEGFPTGNGNILLKDGDTLFIRGLSPNATISYEETNDTTNTYMVRAAAERTGDGEGITLVEETPKANGEKTTVDSFFVSNYSNRVSLPEGVSVEGFDPGPVNDNDDVSDTAYINPLTKVVFTNKIESVSPTGVILRFAPFAILIGFAAALLAISRKTGSKKDKTRSI